MWDRVIFLCSTDPELLKGWYSYTMHDSNFGSNNNDYDTLSMCWTTIMRHSLILGPIIALHWGGVNCSCKKCEKNSYYALMFKVQRIMKAHFLMRLYTMWRISTGLRNGGKGGWISGSMGDSFSRAIARLSIVACHSQSWGLLSRSWSMGNSTGGIGSSERLAGTLTSGYGKFNVTVN